MTKVLPSTFQMLDRQLSVIDDRRYTVYAIRHFSVPFTIVADIIIGVAHLIFLSVKQELTQKDFWEISHEHFFVYPFQQITYVIFSTVGTLMIGNYFEGYREGQKGVMSASYEVYQGSPQIFAHIIASYDRPQYFPGITLTDLDRFNLDNLVKNVPEFRALQKKLKTNHESYITEAQFVYQVFYDDKPLSIHKLGEYYLNKLVEIPDGCEEQLQWKKDALLEAKSALEAFFALPTVVKNRLIQGKK